MNEERFLEEIFNSIVEAHGTDAENITSAEAVVASTMKLITACVK